MSSYDRRTKIGITPLLVTADKRHLAVAKVLLDNQADVNIHGDKNATALHFAIRNEDQRFVEMLLKYKPDLTVKTVEGDTPLRLAVKKGLVAIAQALQKAGAVE